MKKQSGLGLVGILLIIGTLLLTAGGVVIWQRQFSPTPMPTPTPSATTTPRTQPTESPEKAILCQTSADCPPGLGVCVPGNCPSWRCVSGRCVYFEDVSNEVYEP
jgi:hypothetical protein